MINKFKGKIYGVLLAFSVSLLFLSNKLVDKVNIIEKIYYRGFTNVLFTLFLIKNKEIYYIPTNKITLKLLIIRGVLGGFSYSSMFIGIYFLNLQIFTIITTTNTIFSVLFSSIYLGEKLTFQFLICFFISFIGIIITLCPNLLNLNFKEINEINYIGVFFAFMNSITTAINRTFIKKHSILNRCEIWSLS